MLIHFDCSLPKLCEIISQELGGEILARSVVVRDASGRLFLVVPTDIESVQREHLSTVLKSRLGQYARIESPIGDLSYPGSTRLIAEASKEPVTFVDGHAVKLLDRRIVGSEWLRSPSLATPKIPRIVFSSLKGGVGRSTALCVAAAHLSRKGRRVLAIDFDLEAPGIGTMILSEEELPKYGMLDYLVEAGLANTDEDFLSELSGDSFLGAAGARVTVVPAIGRSTLRYPQNALAKIARAYLEVPQEVGPPKTITDQLAKLLAYYEALEAYDVVLIDGRSGLHETAASLMLGLGAEVLLFGQDQPQTFQGYRLLLAQLARFPFNLANDWREQLSFVHSKATDSVLEREEAVSKFRATFDLLRQRSPGTALKLTEDDFEVEWEDDVVGFPDDQLEVKVLHVLDDTNYRRFDPIREKRIMDASVYTNAFGSLLDYLDLIVGDEVEDI